MARTSLALIQGIIAVNPAIPLAGPIRTAHILTNKVAAYGLEHGVTQSRETLTEIETYLAAHFYTFRDQQYASKQTGRASATFQGKTDMALDSSFYGQTAKLLDASGYLESLGAETVSVLWGGIDYDNAPQPPGN